MRAVVLGLLILAVSIGAPLALAPRQDREDLGEPGPYAVGLSRQLLSRQLPDGQTRTVETFVWYPAPRPDDMPPGIAVAADSRRTVAPGGPFPLIVFSHGSGAASTLYSKLLSHLASLGFVVAGPNHQDCTTCNDPDRGGSITNRPADVSMVVDRLLELNASDDPLLHGLVDPARIGMAGHSYGGWTSLQALERDPRFRAALVMSPGLAQDTAPQPEHVSKPVMLFSGVLDSMATYGLISRFFQDIPLAAPDHYLLASQQIGHQFHDQCYESFVTTTCATTLPQPRVQAIMNRVGAAFLLEYVAGARITDSQLGLHDRSSEYVVLKASRDAVTAVPTAEPIHEVTVVPEQPPGAVLVSDDLSMDRGSLPASSTDPARYDAGYRDGTYEIAARRPNTAGESVLPGARADASISVDAQVADPTPGQAILLGCRSQGVGQQYRFGFRPATGESWLLRAFVKPGFDGVPRYLTRAHLLAPSFNPGPATNRLELSCRGTTLTARVNGETVASVSDNTFAQGHLWIGVGEQGAPSGASQGPVARFSNLVVRQE